MANSEHLAKLIEGVKAWNAWRHTNRSAEPPLVGADLSGIELRGFNLSRADLSDTNLSRADLSDSYFLSTILLRADLSGARLTRANLTGTDLRGSNLIGTDLSGAILSSTDFSGAILNGTNLTGASSAWTVWASSDLSVAEGLIHIHHASASTVSVDTLTLSKGKIPAVFLKGCGLADWEIESAKLYDPDLTESEISEIQYRAFELRSRGPIQISPVFISYSHADAAFVDKVGTALDGKGVRYWRDIKDATAGRLDKVIERGITLNPTLLIILSEHSVKSNWVEYEVDKAVELSGKLNRDVLCPIALDDAWLKSDRMSGQLRSQIKKYQVLDFSGHGDEPTFKRQFQKLADGLGLYYRDKDGKPKKA